MKLKGWLRKSPRWNVYELTDDAGKKMLTLDPMFRLVAEIDECLKSAMDAPKDRKKVEIDIIPIAETSGVMVTNSEITEKPIGKKKKLAEKVKKN